MQHHQSPSPPNILHLLSSPSQQFNVQPILLTLCKPTTNPPEIDFLTLPQTLQQINTFHQRTCQQIVQFVDAHCQQYLKMNQKFQQLGGSVERVEGIVKEVGVRLSDYAQVYYNNQGKVQQLITNYELSILQHVLLSKCNQSTHFLTKFIASFQSIATKPITHLSFTQRHLLIKFCHHFSQFSTILYHHIVQQSIPQANKIEQLMVNLVDQVQFYLSQQLQRVIGGIGRDNNTKKDNTKKDNNDNKVINNNNKSNLIMNEIKLCYTYLNKLPQYYRLIQQYLISLDIQSAQRNLISQKINLIGGKSIQVVEEYFKAIFNIFNHLPVGYPKQRVLQLIFSLLKKNQIKFLYTYTLPIFPISYNCYIKQIQEIDKNNQNERNNEVKEIIQVLSKNHNWDLRRWVDVREKNVIDRCGKDWERWAEVKNTINNTGGQTTKKQLQPVNNTKPLTALTSPQTSPVPDLIKWLQIIFKQNCKISGIKNNIVQLAIKVINKYAMIIQKSLTQQSLQPEFINCYVRTCMSIEDIMLGKLGLFYDKELKEEEGRKEEVKDKDNNIRQAQVKQLDQLIKKIAKSCEQSLHKALDKVISINTKLLSKSCCGCLQPYKQFIMKIIKHTSSFTTNKQQSPTNTIKYINSLQTIFKPLHAYLQSTAKLSQQSKLWIRNIVIKQVMKFYDQSYVTEIYQYARVNLSVEQLADVMAVVGKQRSGLFVTDSQESQ